MNRDIVAGNWKQIHGSLKTQWGRFTGNRPEVVAGMRLVLAGRVQADCGNTGEEAGPQLKQFIRSNKNYRLKNST